MYILRFNTMRMPHKAIQWAQVCFFSPSHPSQKLTSESDRFQETRKEQSNPFWNVWILLAIPAVWLVW
jgi:hypothetical protein